MTFHSDNGSGYARLEDYSNHDRKYVDYGKQMQKIE
jgi:hypothetical protein